MKRPLTNSAKMTRCIYFAVVALLAFSAISVTADSDFKNVPAVGNIMDNVIGKLPVIGDSDADAGSKLPGGSVKGFVKKLPVVGDSDSSNVEGYVNGVTGNLPLVGDSDSTNVEGYVTKVVGGLPVVGDSDSGSVAGYVAGVTGNLPLVGDSDSTNVEGYVNNVVKKLPVVGDGSDTDTSSAKDYGKGFVDGVTGNLPLVGDSDSTDVAGYVSKVVKKLPVVGDSSDSSGILEMTESDIPFYGDGKQLGGTAASSVANDGNDGTEFSALFTIVVAVGLATVVVALVTVINRKKTLTAAAEKSKLLPEETMINTHAAYGSTYEPALSNAL